MAIEVLDLRFQKWFNQIFNNIENCEIVNPPYNEAFKSQYFFLKKRVGVSGLYVNESYKFLDISWYRDDNKIEEFLLWKDQDWKYVVFKKTDTWYEEVLTISEWGEYDWFVSILWGGQRLVDEGEADGGDVNHLVDNDKSWSDNELAGYYVFLYDKTWAGQLRQILSNTSNSIEVSWWDAQPVAWTKYKIYESLVYVIAIPYNWGLYVYDWVEWWSLPMFEGFNITNVAFWENRLWWTSWNRLYYSEQWDYFYSPYWNELILSDKDVNNLYPYWTYLLVSTSEKIWLVYKWLSTETGKEFLALRDGLLQIWVKNKNAIGIYKWGLYFISSDNRLYTLQVQVVGTDIILISQDYWDMPANFISRYQDFDIVLYADVKYLYLITTDWEVTYEFFYDSYYQWWLSNKYSISFYKKKFVRSKEYVIWNWFIWIRWWTTDLWKPFGQKIRAVIWEQDVWQWKEVKFVNLLFGLSDYVQSWQLNVYANIANKRIGKTRNIDWVGYISDQADLVENTYGSSLLWLPILWGDKADLYNRTAVVDIVQVNVWFTWQIIELELTSAESENGLFFGWFFVYINKVHPKLKYYRNII